MPHQLRADLLALDEATSRLVRTADALTDAEAAGPSLLPGWTRGHVLTHLARNADALVGLVDGALTGVAAPMYPSVEARAADIEAGAISGCGSGPSGVIDRGVSSFSAQKGRSFQWLSKYRIFMAW